MRNKILGFKTQIKGFKVVFRGEMLIFRDEFLNDFFKFGGRIAGNRNGKIDVIKKQFITL